LVRENLKAVTVVVVADVAVVIKFNVNVNESISERRRPMQLNGYYEDALHSQ